MIIDFLSLIVLFIGITFVYIYFESTLLALCGMIMSWYMAFECLDTPLLAIFFAVVGLIALFNSISYAGLWR